MLTLITILARAVDYCNDGIKVPQPFKSYIIEIILSKNVFKTKYFQTPPNRFSSLSSWFKKINFSEIFAFLIRGILAKIAQNLSFPGLNANRLGILLRAQQGMAFHAWINTFFVSFKILLFFGVKSVTLDLCKKSTFFDTFFPITWPKLVLRLKDALL